MSIDHFKRISFNNQMHAQDTLQSTVTLKSATVLRGASFWQSPKPFANTFDSLIIINFTWFVGSDSGWCAQECIISCAHSLIAIVRRCKFSTQTCDGTGWQWNSRVGRLLMITRESRNSLPKELPMFSSRGSRNSSPDILSFNRVLISSSGLGVRACAPPPWPPPLPSRPSRPGDWPCRR